jgi:hypothetical protein
MAPMIGFGWTSQPFVTLHHSAKLPATTDADAAYPNPAAANCRTPNNNSATRANTTCSPSATRANNGIRRRMIDEHGGHEDAGGKDSHRKQAHRDLRRRSPEAKTSGQVWG